ncbi:MAG: hypothetical protein V2A76_14090, partial [Planctomycetota bacterium]
MKSLLIHLELCECCGQAVDLLRRQVRAHQDAAEFQEVLSSFDKDSFFEKLNGSLLATNLDRLSGLLYELGKAYFHAGNDSRLISYLHKKTESIERSRAEGRRLVKESSGIARQAGGSPRKVGQSMRRADQLFRGRRAGRIGSKTGRNPLDNARRFLEECLILNPSHPQARIYLGYYFVRVDRPEEGLREYRKLLSLPNLPKSMRVMTLQAMGNAHAYRLEYEKAIECFDLIVTEGVLDNDSRFFTVLLSLAMFHAKLGKFDRSSETFGDLVERFPQMVERARDMLEQAEVFRSLLAQHATFRTELLRRYPMLFAG